VKQEKGGGTISRQKKMLLKFPPKNRATPKGTARKKGTSLTEGDPTTSPPKKAQWERPNTTLPLREWESSSKGKKRDSHGRVAQPFSLLFRGEGAGQVD